MPGPRPDDRNGAESLELDPLSETSVLLYGSAPVAMLVLASGLAARVGGTFGWANAGGTLPPLEPELRQRIEERADGRPIDRFRPEDFDRPLPDPRAIGDVVEPGSAPPDFEERMMEFLRLPRILQTLIARTNPATRRGAVVFSGLESLPPAYLERAVVSPEAHRALHSQGVALIGTYRGVPPTRLRDAFALEFEVAQPPGGPWTEATVRTSKPAETAAGPTPVPLRAFWSREGLETILPLPD
jgi:hypothetical protein